MDGRKRKSGGAMGDLRAVYTAGQSGGEPLKQKIVDLHPVHFVTNPLVTKQTRSLTLNLQDGNECRVSQNSGTLTVHAEETMASKSVIQIQFRCQIDNIDDFPKTDPFIRVSKNIESGGNVGICETAIQKPLFLSMLDCESKDNPLLIECLDVNGTGNHALIGTLQKSVADLERLFKERSGVNFNIPSSHGPEKASKGQLFVDEFIEEQQFSFLDYISSGFELNFMVVVDFTASNGDSQLVNSLHHISDDSQLNSYQQAIIEVGKVIELYDADKRFPAWGFGGSGPAQPVSHCFNLDGTASGINPDGTATGINPNGTATGIMILNGQRLKNSQGQEATRKNVQFVAMGEVQTLLEQLHAHFLS